MQMPVVPEARNKALAPSHVISFTKFLVGVVSFHSDTHTLVWAISFGTGKRRNAIYTYRNYGDLTRIVNVVTNTVKI